MESMGKMPRRRRSFTPEFKAEIVELCQREDRSIGQVARDFDLSETSVREWVRQAKRDAGARDDCGLTHRAHGLRPEQAGQARFKVESGMPSGVLSVKLGEGGRGCENCQRLAVSASATVMSSRTCEEVIVPAVVRGSTMASKAGTAHQIFPQSSVRHRSMTPSET